MNEIEPHQRIPIIDLREAGQLNPQERGCLLTESLLVPRRGALVLALAVGVSGGADTMRGHDMPLGPANAEAHGVVLDQSGSANQAPFSTRTTISMSELSKFAGNNSVSSANTEPPVPAPIPSPSSTAEATPTSTPNAEPTAPVPAATPTVSVEAVPTEAAPTATAEAASPPVELSVRERNDCSDLTPKRFSGNARFTGPDKRRVRLIVKFTKFPEMYKKCRAVSISDITVSLSAWQRLKLAGQVYKFWNNMTQDYKPKDPATGKPLVVSGNETRTLVDTVLRVTKMPITEDAHIASANGNPVTRVDACARNKKISSGRIRRTLFSGGFEVSALQRGHGGDPATVRTSRRGMRLGRLPTRGVSNSQICFRPKNMP